MTKQIPKGLMLAILLVTGCVGPQDRAAISATPTQGTHVVVTQGFPQSVRAFEQRALETATRWRPDAYLAGASVIVPASRPDGTFTIRGSVSFDFLSRADVEHWYTVNFDSQGTLKVFEFPSRMTQFDVLPIESSDWPLDSIDAWRIAQANGGSALLQEYEEQTVDMRCLAVLQRWNPPYSGRVVWDISCMDAVMLKSFDFEIDAKTGEVIEKAAK